MALLSIRFAMRDKKFWFEG